MRRLFTTFGYLVATQGAVALIGLAYWAVVTHLFGPTEVGVSAAAASTALLLAAFGALGVPLLCLLAEIESVRDIMEQRVLFTTGNADRDCSCVRRHSWLSARSRYLLWLGQSLRIIGANPAAATLFIVGSAGTIAGLTLDGAAIGLHRGAAQLWRGSLSALLKLACAGVLVLLSTRTSTGLILAWAMALLLAFFICIPMLGLERHTSGDGTLVQRRAFVRQFGKLSLQHHVLNLSISSVFLHRPAHCNPPDLTVGRCVLSPSHSFSALRCW